jgi:GTPase
VPVTLLVPYNHGEVVSRIHRHGEMGEVEHTADGTRLTAKVPGWLTGDLARYAVEPVAHP